MQLNQHAFEHAKSLIIAGKVVKGENWKQVRPSLSDENRFLQEKDWDTYRQWFLGVNQDVTPNTKGRLSFLYGDFEKVHRDALIDIQKFAREYDYDDILEAVNLLIVQIDKKPDVVQTASDDSFPASDPPNWRGRNS